MADGLIAAAIGGFGKALSSIGEMEAKKQNEAKLRRELMDMESEERLRLDEISFKREMERAPIRAKTTAEANVIGEAAGLKAAETAGLPDLRAQAKVGEKTSLYAAEDKAGLTTIEAKRDAEKIKAGLTAKSEAGIPEAQGKYSAAEKIEARLAELSLSALKNLSALEAKAKYDALIADIDAAEKSGIDVREARRKANVILADINAKTEAKVPEAQGKYSAAEKIEARLAELNLSALKNLPALEAKAKYDALIADIDAAEKSGIDVREARRKANAILADINAKKEAGVPKAEAAYAVDKRREEIRATIEKNLDTEEANLLARQEKAKIQAMTAQGVPEAEAKLLSAKWRAQKAQRDEAAAEKTQQEMNDLITKMKSKEYKGALKTKEAIDATSGLILQANKDNRDKKDRERNTIEMERQIKETEKEMGRILGVGDPKKIPDEINYLESQAKKGDKDAAAKLARLKPLTDELNNLSRELRTYKRGGTNTSAGEATYRKGEERTLSDGPNKGKTVVWDGTKWNLK